MSEENEIFGKIEDQHRAGAHVTGPQAGCRICAALVEQKDAQSLVAAVEDGLSADEAIDELALRRAVTAAAAETSRRSPTSNVPGVDEIQSWTHARYPNSLGEVALQDAQQALDDLNDLAMRQIIIPNENQALVHAQVGVVRVLVGIEYQLARLVDAFTAQAAGERMERLQSLGVVESAGPPPEHEAPGPDEGARLARAERIAREGLPDEPEPPAA